MQSWHVMSTNKEGLSGMSSVDCGFHVLVKLPYLLMFKSR